MEIKVRMEEDKVELSQNIKGSSKCNMYKIYALLRQKIMGELHILIN